MVRKLYVTALIVIACSMAVASQTPGAVPEGAGFSGTWQTKRGTGDRRTNLVITQADNAFTITETLVIDKPITNTRTLYIDKRGERNLMLIPGLDVTVEVESSTEIKDGKLVRNASFQTPYYSGGTRRVSTQRETETYGLSKDGKTLTIWTNGTLQDQTELHQSRNPRPPARPDVPQTVTSRVLSPSEVRQRPIPRPAAQPVPGPNAYQRKRVFTRVP